MMLYTKGERRYTEASNSDILTAAAGVLSEMGMGEQSTWLRGVADAEQAHENRQFHLIGMTETAAKKIMMPGTAPIKEPRRGTEPA